MGDVSSKHLLSKSEPQTPQSVIPVHESNTHKVEYAVHYSNINGKRQGRIYVSEMKNGDKQETTRTLNQEEITELELCPFSFIHFSLGDHEQENKSIQS
jgi:hypothetical protein